jgi:hypothetical protein
LDIRLGLGWSLGDPLGHVGEDVAERLAVVGVQRRGRSADEHGTRDELLELCGLLQDVEPLGLRFPAWRTAAP